MEKEEGKSSCWRLEIRVQGIDGWLLPLQIGDRISLRMLKPEEFYWSWACMLVGLTEDVEGGQRVTHLEFISESRP
jgi:hypothetical protein